MVLPLWKIILQFLKKVDIELTYNTEIPFLSVYPREWKTYSYKNLHKNIHSSIIFNSQKVEITRRSINWIMAKQIWYIHTMEYYLAIKSNKVLIHDKTWINLENIMLSEISVTQKDKYCMIPSLLNA